MRDLKFRAYLHDNGEIYPVLFINFDKRILTLAIEKTLNEEWYRNEMLDKVQLKQYTGLKDNKGIEIFEGDVIEHNDGEFSFKGIVVHSPFGWYVKNKNDCIAMEHFSDEINKESDCVIIGNKFEI